MSQPVMKKEISPPGQPSARKLKAFKNLEKRLEDILQDGSSQSKISFGFSVLQSVVHANFDRALAELDSVAHGIEGYPEFSEKSERYIEHAKSLVMAIQTKRAIGLSPHINKSKQKEMGEKITEHFSDLKKCIIIIEKIEKSIRAKDLGASIYFFRTFYFCIVAIVGFLLVQFMWPDFGDQPINLLKYFFWPE